MFNVTKKHIEEGKRFEVDMSGYNCPVSLAIQEEFGTKKHRVTVGSQYSMIMFNSFVNHRVKFEHSEELTQWIKDFDERIEVEEKTLYIHEDTDGDYFLGFQEDIGKGKPVDSLEIY